MGKLVRLRDRRIHAIAIDLVNRIVLTADLASAELPNSISKNDLILVGRRALVRNLHLIRRKQPERWGRFDQALIAEVTSNALLAMMKAVAVLEHQSPPPPSPAVGFRIRTTDIRRTGLR